MNDVATLARNHVDLLPEGALEAKLKLGRPLRVKLGIDVTSPDIHVGRGIPLQRMRAFQDAGHVGVLIVGDYTTRIGDPSGRSAERPILTDEEIDRNAKTYVDQAMQILDPGRTEVRHNGEWLAQLSFADVVRLTRTLTVAQLLERDDFAKRIAGGHPVSVSELLYPLMQAYDSVAIEADVELGGTDQLYNLLAGRTVMEAYGLAPQVVLTTPLLLSWDGAKMSSSVGNNIPLTAPPEEQFGRTMRIPDELLPDWYRLVVEEPRARGRAHGGEARAGTVHRAPLARGRRRPARRRRHFTRVVREGGAPEDVPEAPLPDGASVHLPALLAGVFGLSTSDARRMIGQGGVKVDGAGRRGARPAPGGARRCARSRPASVGSCACRTGPTALLDRPPAFATIPSPPEREAARAPLSLDTGAAFERIGYDLYRITRRPLARVGGLFAVKP